MTEDEERTAEMPGGTTLEALREAYQAACSGWPKYAVMERAELFVVIQDLLTLTRNALTLADVEQTRQAVAIVATYRPRDTGNAPVPVPTDDTPCRDCGQPLGPRPAGERGRRSWNHRGKCPTPDYPEWLQDRDVVTIINRQTPRARERECTNASGLPKVGYRNSQDAYNAALRRIASDWKDLALEGRKWNVYPCSCCQQWHIGTVWSEELAIEPVLEAVL